MAQRDDLVGGLGLVSVHRYQEETRKAIESINAVMSHLGAAAVDLLTDRDKLLMLVAGGTALAVGVYGAREGVRVAGKTAEMWLGTPKLVRGGGAVAGLAVSLRLDLSCHWALDIMFEQITAGHSRLEVAALRGGWDATGTCMTVCS